MPVTLPINNAFSNFSQELTLDGVSYRFDFTYNTRSLQWVLSISDIDLVPIVEGIKLILGYELFDQYRSYPLPPGELYCVDTTGDEDEITRENLGPIVEIVYIPEAEVDTI